MTTTDWIFANVCYFILFIVDFPAYMVDNWTCEDTYTDYLYLLVSHIGITKSYYTMIFAYV